MCRAYLDNLNSLFDKCIHVKQSLWLENCSDYKNLYDQILLVFDVRSLEKLFDPDSIANFSVHLCKFILTNYIESASSFYTTLPSNTSEYFSRFVATIHVHLVKSKADCRASRLNSIVFSLLEECFIPNAKQDIYISQLQVFLKNKEIQAVLGADSSEMSSLRSNVVARLNGKV